MKRGIFHKYFVGFASFFLVPLAVLSICLQVILYQDLSKEILRYNENILERLGDDLVTMNGRLMETGNKISFSKPVLAKLYTTGNQIKMIDTLRKESLDNSYITMAYLVNRDNDTCFSSQGKYEKKTLLDKQLRIPAEEREDFLNRLYSVNEPEYDVIHKQYNLKAGPLVQQQMIFIYPVYNYNKREESWVILELKESKIKIDSISSTGSYSSGLIVLNQNGKMLITEGNNSLELQNDEILDAPPEKSSIIYNGTDKQKLLVYSMKNPKLIIVDQISVPNLLMNIIENNSVLVMGVLVFLMLGCVMAIYVAYRYYKPIRQLAQYMRQENEPETRKNELDYIKNQYDSLNSVKESLSKEIENQWPFVKERLITRLLYDGVQENGETDIVGRAFEEQMNHKKHFVALIIRQNQSNQNFEAVYKEKAAGINMEFQDEYMVYSTYIYYYEAISIILSRDEMMEEKRKDVQAKLQQKFEGDGCIISLGNIYEDAYGVHVSFLEALTDIKYRLLNPQKEYKLDGMVQKSEEEYGSRINLYQTECLLSINRCLDNGNVHEVDKSVNEVVLNLGELPGQMALMCCYDIVSQLIKVVKKKNIRLTEMDLYQLTTFRTVDEFGEKLKAALVRICEDITVSQREIQNMLAQQIMDYIDQKYQDSNLSLVGMSGHFGYSSSYMSKFITQNLNVSFSDLVADKRLSYTKECLINTDKQIAQIAQEAGYVNLSNFTRRFKSSENMTPGQFRSLYGKSKK
ncbi:MAG: helix-turn-helix transcriptional regulator [Anaerocolumna sp.]